MQFSSFLISRILTFLLVVWIGVTTVFFVPRVLPADPVEAMLGKITSQGAFMDPDAVEKLRESLTDAFGLKGSLLLQYGHFLKRVLLTGDFGPSLAMYPTPVMQLIKQALPWTMGLLLTSTIIAWMMGNAIGLIAGYRKNKTSSKILESLAVFVYPIPYYILALVLIILFAYIIPIFPLSTNANGVRWSFEFILSVIYNSILPALSIIIVGLGWWVISMKALSSDIAEEDYVHYAKLKGLKEGPIMRDYVARNAILPQITTLALHLGTIFNGALITEILFNYPGLGSLIYNAILQADYNLMMGAITLSVVAVSLATLVIDLVYPFLDPRIRYK